MIFKFLCLQKQLLKSQEFGTCYAGRGRRSGTPHWGYPSHRYRGGPHSAHEAADGYAAPKAPAGQSCLDGEYFNAGHANMTMLVSYSYEKANTTRRRNVIRI